MTDDPDRTFTAVVTLVLPVPHAVVAPTRPGAATAGVGVLAAMHVTTAVVRVSVIAGRLEPC